MAPFAKRRRTNDNQPQEIAFDPSAREEYLTGFHKRKQQRKEHARETAAKRDKEEKVLQRRQLREQRKEDLERHVTEVNAELKKLKRDVEGEDSSDAESEGAEGGGEWEGIEEPATVEVLPDDEEFVDEDKYTTVTVEAMDGEDSKQQGGDGEEFAVKAAEPVKAKSVAKKPARSKDDKTKPKKKKFRYESKAERSATRAKQKSKNHKAKLRRTGN